MSAQPEFAFRAEDGTYHASPAEARTYNLCCDAAQAYMRLDIPTGFPPLIKVLREKPLRDKLIALLARHGFVWENA